MFMIGDRVMTTDEAWNGVWYPATITFVYRGRNRYDYCVKCDDELDKRLERKVYTSQLRPLSCEDNIAPQSDTSHKRKRVKLSIEESRAEEGLPVKHTKKTGVNPLPKSITDNAAVTLPFPEHIANVAVTVLPVVPKSIENADVVVLPVVPKSTENTDVTRTHTIPEYIANIGEYFEPFPMFILDNDWNQHRYDVGYNTIPQIQINRIS
jgi:Agenet domain